MIRREGDELFRRCSEKVWLEDPQGRGRMVAPLLRLREGDALMDNDNFPDSEAESHFEMERQKEQRYCHELAEAIASQRLCEHKWIGYKNPNTPDGFGDYIEYCRLCGMENPGSWVEIEMLPITEYREERHPFDIDNLPPFPPPGIMWVFEENGQPVSVDFLCPCGCGQSCYTPLICERNKNHPYKWTYGNKGSGPTLTPSIRYLAGCKSHFNVTDGKVAMHGDSGR